MGKLLASTYGGEFVQVFKLVKGKLNKTNASGTLAVGMVYCVADGSFTITWPSQTIPNPSLRHPG